MIHFPLFESICFYENQFPLLNYHLLRMQNTCEKLFSSSFQKEHELMPVLQGIHSKDKMKVRVEYDKKHFKVSSTIYHPKEIQSVKLVSNNEMEYPYKFTDRHTFLHYQHEHEEVVFVKNNLLTETTFSNIALWNGEEWHTPTKPLLHGTRRQYLLENGKVIEKDITVSDLSQYSRLSFINGMLDLDEMNFPVVQIND